MTARTSQSHPLVIATVPAGPGAGLVGVTLCPGKKDKTAMTGAWARDLATDMAAIRAWNAAAVVTLMEEHELAMLGVGELGAAVADAHLAWFHLPIVDRSTPDAGFERAWAGAGAAVRALLGSGANVLFHCRGGLGRSGMIAARTLVELGWPADKAVIAIRAVRPGAIETEAQKAHVHAARASGDAPSDTSAAARRDRARGALLGLAVGDALGTTLEFKRRDSVPPVRDIVGGGPFRLKPGEWTDDTAMALALADSLVAHPEGDARDLMDRFVRWWRAGEYSCNGRCFDIGNATRAALARYEDTENPLAGDDDPHSAGNGSLMRLAPVAIAGWADDARARALALWQGRTTHAAPETLAACAAFAPLLAAAIRGTTRRAIFAATAASGAPATDAVMAGSWRGKTRDTIRSSGYVIHSLEAALWCVARTTSFRDAVVLAANLGDDADTVAAITGQLAGALYGATAIPPVWLAVLAWRNRLSDAADALFATGSAGF